MAKSHVRAHTHTHTRARTRTHAHAPTHARTHTHTHIHTYTEEEEEERRETGSQRTITGTSVCIHDDEGNTQQSELLNFATTSPQDRPLGVSDQVSYRGNKNT